MSTANYVKLSGASGNYASTPDAAANEITGDIDVQVRLNPTSWKPAASQELVAKYTSSTATSSYEFILVGASGKLELACRLSAAGAATLSTVAVPFADGTAGWVRATRVAATGAITYYTAADQATPPSSWTMLGTATSATSGNIQSTATVLAVGAPSAGTSTNYAGNIYRALVISGIGGTTNVDFNPNDARTAAASWTSSATGEVWTLHGSGTFIEYVIGFTAAGATWAASPLSIARPRTISLTAATAAWAPIALTTTHGRTVSLTPATAAWVPVALSITRPRTVTLTPATAAWAASSLSVTHARTITLTPATAAWATVALVITRGAVHVTLTPALAVWSARPLVTARPRTVTLTTATATWAAVPVGVIAGPVMVTLSSAKAVWAAVPLVAPTSSLAGRVLVEARAVAPVAVSARSRGAATVTARRAGTVSVETRGG